jgi:hypothetical protein
MWFVPIYINSHVKIVGLNDNQLIYMENGRPYAQDVTTGLVREYASARLLAPDTYEAYLPERQRDHDWDALISDKPALRWPDPEKYSLLDQWDLEFATTGYVVRIPKHVENLVRACFGFRPRMETVRRALFVASKESSCSFKFKVLREDGDGLEWYVQLAELRPCTFELVVARLKGDTRPWPRSKWR